MFFLDRFSFKKWFLFEAINTPLLAGQHRKVFPQATEQEITDKINLAVAADPTPNKKYINWIFRELLKSRIRLPEDTPVVQQQLTLFEKSKPALKRLGKELNIDKYDKNQLWQTLSELGGATSARQEKQAIKQEGAQEVYNDGEWLVMKMTKGEACSFYARGTKWCTSNPKIASGYLEQGPIYIIYHNKQIYAQFHIESEQFMNPEDVPIDPEKVPDKLKEIVEKYIVKTDKVKRNKMFGIKERILTFPDGHYWGTADYHSILLINPNNVPEVKVRVTEGMAFVERPNNMDAKSLFGREGMAGVKNYIPPSHWNKYILQLLINLKEINRIGIYADQWTLGDLSSQELRELQKTRPDLFPETYFETSNGYLWTEGDGKDRRGYPEQLVLMDNWQPILVFNMSSGHQYLNYGKWLADSLYQTFIKNKELNKQKYSLATTELILHDKISHMDTRRDVSHGNWSLNDLLPEHKQLILQSFPGFAEPFSLVSKVNSGDRKSIVKEIARLGQLSHLILFDEDNVVVDDYDIISPQVIIDKHSNRMSYDKEVGVNIRAALRKKIMGEFGVDDDWKLRDLLQANDIEAVHKAYPFMDAESLELAKKQERYDVGNALNVAVGNVIMPKVIKLIYDKLKPYSNNKFKVVLMDNKIYFLTSYDELIEDFKKDKELKNLYEEYKVWKKSMNVDWEGLIQVIEKMPRTMDKDKFKEVIEQGYNHPEYRKYDIEAF